jgi:hypothetical protein
MRPIRFLPSSLKEGRWYEYVDRFALGGAATVFTGLVSSRYGASVGGLFLALPAIFCAGATLIEKHETRKRKRRVSQARGAGSRQPLSTLSARRWERWACWRSRRSFGCRWKAAFSEPSKAMTEAAAAAGSPRNCESG